MPLPEGGICLKFFKPIAVLIFLIVSLLSAPGQAQWADNVQVMTGSPGDTLTFYGQGTPCTEAMIDISTTVWLDAKYSNGQLLYDISMNNVKIPSSHNSFSVSASPVRTMTVWGKYLGLKISQDAGVSGDMGSFSISNVPASTYTIGVNGIANGSKVRLEVHARSGVKVDKSGNFSACMCTSGMPAGVYSVTQDGMPIAKVYLGVAGPATPTPAPTVCPSPSPSATCVPDRIIVPASHSAANVRTDKVELLAADEAAVPSPVPTVAIVSDVLSEAPVAGGPSAAGREDGGSTLGLLVAGLAACGICGAGGYFLLFKRK